MIETMRLTNLKHQLHEIICLSELMLQNASDGLWDEVTDMQTQRNKLIHKLFDDIPAFSKEELAANIRKMLSMDEQTMKLIEHNRSDLLTEMNKIQQGKKAVNAYAQQY